MKLLMHLVPLAGLMLSVLFSTQPVICVLLGLIMLPVTTVIERLGRRTTAPATVDPYAAKPAPPPGPSLWLLAGLAMIAVAAFMVTRLLPLPQGLAAQRFVDGGFYYCLGSLVGLGVFFFYLAWSAKRGATQ